VGEDVAEVAERLLELGPEAAFDHLPVVAQADLTGRGDRLSNPTPWAERSDRLCHESLLLYFVFRGAGRTARLLVRRTSSLEASEVGHDENGSRGGRSTSVCQRLVPRRLRVACGRFSRPTARSEPAGRAPCRRRHWRGRSRGSGRTRRPYPPRRPRPDCG